MSGTEIENTQQQLLRVLFVDDEQSLLDGLRRSMRSMRSIWDMSFANFAEDALAIMAESPVDVVVSDMRMPRIDGLELLTRVRDLYPETVRIVLSGQTEIQTALRSVSIAQAFLHKPSEPEAIKAAINRALERSGELGNDAIRRMIARVDALPSPSVVVQKLNECILRPDANVSDVATIAATDAAITAKLLQLANSSFFGIARPVTDVEDAITLIGISTVRDLATGSKLYDVPTTDAGPMDISELETHTNEVAHIARALCSNTDIAREAFCAGVLHDIGELVLAIGFPDEEAEIRRRMTTGEDRCSLENELFDVTHAAIGAHLLRLWGLPASIVEAVAWHHDAPQHEPWELNTLHATYLAELISKHGTDISSLVPAGYLERLGCQPLPALTGKEFT